MEQKERWAQKIAAAVTRIKPGAMRLPDIRCAATGSRYVRVRIGGELIIVRVSDHPQQSEYGWTSRDGEASHDAADVDYCTGGGRRCPSRARIRGDIAAAIRLSRAELAAFVSRERIAS